MHDKYGDILKVYTTEGKINIFVDCFHGDSPENIEFRAVLGKDEAKELISKLQEAMKNLK